MQYRLPSKSSTRSTSPPPSPSLIAIGSSRFLNETPIPGFVGTIGMAGGAGVLGFTDLRESSVPASAA